MNRRAREDPGHAGVFDVHVFLAAGSAKPDNDAGCRPGARHSLLIFSRQPEGTEADPALARKGAAYAGWTRVKLERSRRLAPASPPAEATLLAAFNDSLALGCSVVADRRELGSTPRGPRVRDRRGKKGKA